MPTDPSVELPINPDDLNDEVLSALQQAINSTVSTRAQLAAAPQQAITACWSYKGAGGDPQVVVDAAQAWVTANK